jgi:hypothetical protein
MAKALQIALKNFTEHMRENDTPACFTTEEFRAWKLHEEEMKTLPLRSFICRDCTVVYQKEMLAQGRCFQVGVDITKVAD